MKRALVISAAVLSLVWACAHPIEEASSDDRPTSSAKGGSGGVAGMAGRGGSGGHGGSKSSGVAGSTGKSGSAGRPAAGGADGSGDGGAAEPDPDTGGQPGVIDPGPSTEAGELAVHYKAGNASLNDNQIGAHLRIVSSALAPVELSALSLRYYFTSEPAPPLLIEIYTIAAEGSSGYRALPSGSVLAAANDGFVEVSFTAAAGLLDAGGQVTVEIAVHDTNWSGLFDESNDYSFDAAHSTFAAWDHVTLYDGKTLVSGIEPA